MKEENKKITLLCVGSRGDVQPYLALGKGLQDVGYEVTVITSKDFESVVQKIGCHFVPTVGSVREILQSEFGQKMMSGGRIAWFRNLSKLLNQFFHRIIKDTYETSFDAKAFIFSGISHNVGVFIAQKLNIPCAGVFLTPTIPTRYIEFSDFPSSPPFFQSIYNLGSHYLGRIFWWKLFRKAIQKSVKEILGIESIPKKFPILQMKEAQIPLLHCFSELVLKKPLDWHEQAYVSGYWFLEKHSYFPSQGLMNFLKENPSPVYVGFGSMSGHSEKINLLLTILNKLKFPVIYCEGWQTKIKFSFPEAQFFATKETDHQWLLPQCRFAIHHGGSGTTASCLRAGIPMLILPFGGDQPFWARRVQELGVAPAYFKIKDLTEKKIQKSLESILNNPVFQKNAKSLSSQLKEENGVQKAVEILTQELSL